jgi:integrase
MPIKQFTKEFMATGLVCPPERKRIEYSVAGGPGGLFVECRPNAIPVWYVRMKNAKKTNVYKRLGTFAELTLKQAINQAALAKAEHAQAAKQAPEQKAVPGDITLNVFWTDHFYPTCKLHLRSAQRSEQLYRLWLKERYGDIKLADLSRSQFLQYQAELATTHLSPASQDHVIKLARRLLNYAVEVELLERNVLKGIKLRLVSNELHDVADADGIRRYIEVLRSDGNRPVCNVLMYALSTGARLGEILKLTDDQLNLEQGLWTIPAANAKSKKSRTVPLNASALYVLAEAMKLKKTEYVFANPATGKPFTTITRVRHRLQKLAGVKMRAHTLRHQFADSVLANGGSLYSVQLLLGHSDPRVSQRYGRLSLEAQRHAANGASLIVTNSTPPAAPAGQEAVAEAVETAKVLPFPKAA